jgi:hypothetical protein
MKKLFSVLGKTSTVKVEIVKGYRINDLELCCSDLSIVHPSFKPMVSEKATRG